MKITTAGEARFIAVGDIHGHYQLLRRLLVELEKKYIDSRTSIIFMGDYIDRTPDAVQCRATLDLLRDFEARRPLQTFLLKGNHEVSFLEKVDHGVGEIEGIRDWELEIYRDYEPFLRSLLPYYETSRYYFAHAGGVLPDLRLARKIESEDDRHALFWRYDVPDIDYGKTVVRAHRIVAPEKVFGKHIVSIDLGSYRTGFLGAVVLPEGEVVMVKS